MMRFSLLFISLFSTLLLPAQADWELKKDKKGIKVYTKDVAYSKFKAFHGEATIDATLEAVVALFNDLGSYPKWQYNCSSARFLEDDGQLNSTVYIATKSPWPVKDRDGVYQFESFYTKDKGELYIGVRALTDYMNENSEHVRIKKSEGYWTMTRIGENQVHIVYENHSEPGGEIPAWLAKSFVVNVPFETLKKIKKIVKQKQYQGKTYTFLE
ncbi:MAG: START domain-containing protein [Bacteroidota bacterium]